MGMQDKMPSLNDEVLQTMIMEIAIEEKVSFDKAKEAITEYFKGVVTLIESDQPHQIKLNFFGKFKFNRLKSERQEKKIEEFKEKKRLKIIRPCTE